MFTYAARNAILPNLAGFALSLGFVVAGALVMEIVFSYPGIGLTLYNAVTSDDFPLLQGIFLVISLSVLGACLIADIVYCFADPRATGGALMWARTRRVGRPRRRNLPPRARHGQGRSAAILGLFILVAIIGPWIAPL